MLAGELQKQKALFAAGDGVALIAGIRDRPDAARPGGRDGRPPAGQQSSAAVRQRVGGRLSVDPGSRACDLYRMRNGGLQESVSIVRGCSYAAVLTLLAGFLMHIDVSRLTVILDALSIVAVSAGRVAMRQCIRRFYANPKNAIPLVLIGSNRFARYLCDQILDEMTPYEMVGFLDSDCEFRQYRGCPALGAPERLGEIAALYPCLEAAIVLPDAPREQHERIIGLCERQRLRWWLMPWVSKWPNGGLRVDMFGVVPLISPSGSNIEGLNFALKRAFDVAAGIFILIAASPVLALVRSLSGSSTVARSCSARRASECAGGPSTCSNCARCDRPTTILASRLRSAMDSPGRGGSAKRVGRRARIQARERPARNRRRPLAPSLQRRRAATTGQRDKRRDEPDWSAPCSALRLELYEPWHLAAPAGGARNYRPVAG